MHRFDFPFVLLGILLLSACASPGTGLPGRLDQRIAETAGDRVQVSALAVSLRTGPVLNIIKEFREPPDRTVV